MSKLKAVPIGNGDQDFFDGISPGVTQILSISSGASSTPSAAFGSSTKLVRVCTSAACYIEFGASPAATASTSLYLPPNQAEYFVVTPAEKVAVLVTDATVFSVTEAEMT